MIGILSTVPGPAISTPAMTLAVVALYLAAVIAIGLASRLGLAPVASRAFFEEAELQK